MNPLKRLLKQVDMCTMCVTTSTYILYTHARTHMHTHLLAFLLESLHPHGPIQSMHCSNVYRYADKWLKTTHAYVFIAYKLENYILCKYQHYSLLTLAFLVLQK